MHRGVPGGMYCAIEERCFHNCSKQYFYFELIRDTLSKYYKSGVQTHLKMSICGGLHHKTTNSLGMVFTGKIHSVDRLKSIKVRCVHRLKMKSVWNKRFLIQASKINQLWTSLTLIIWVVGVLEEIFLEKWTKLHAILKRCDRDFLICHNKMAQQVGWYVLQNEFR